MSIKVIVTGTTGMVGEGVLHESLLHKDITEVLSISRKDCGVTHPKLKQILIPDFFDLSSIQNELKGYDACLFCLGATSLGVKEEEYKKFTYDLTIHFAQILCGQNPDMTFSYISGYGTDSTEKGKVMWARVKGKTENDLIKLPFKQVFAFRPGFLQATKGAAHVKGFYKWIKWIYPPMRFLFPKFACSLRELGLAMINTAIYGYDKKIIDVTDIVALSKINI
jgi:uncharacterized protein YbjT (DUF2867 family)